MKYALTIIFVLTVITSPGLSQDGINGGLYYAPSKAVNYPFLTSASVASELPTVSAVDNHLMGSADCCPALLPTIAQGIRDTFNALLPCRGLRRQPGHGLLFSARFHQSSCCTNHLQSREVILGPAGEPTPATEAVIPEEIEPERIEDSVRFRRLPAETAPTVLIGPQTTIRAVSGQLNIYPQVNQAESRNRDYPVNPLRQ